MSVPLRYRRRQPQISDPASVPSRHISPASNAHAHVNHESPSQSPQLNSQWSEPYALAAASSTSRSAGRAHRYLAEHRGETTAGQYTPTNKPATNAQPVQYPMEYAMQYQYSNQYAYQHPHYPGGHHPNGHHANGHHANAYYHQQHSHQQHSHQPQFHQQYSASASPNLNGSPNLGQQLTPKPRPYDRADRAKGRIVEHEFTPGKDAIDKLILATSKAALNTPEASPAPSAGSGGLRYKSSSRSLDAVKCKVTVRLPGRQVVKNVLESMTAGELACLLVNEHRLEFDFEHKAEGEPDEIILWECVDGTRRPLRSVEHLGPIVQRWTRWGNKCCLRTTSTALRNDVDSLASLVPRRDMLRTPPKLMGLEVHFSRPSVMYNAIANMHEPRSPPMSPTADEQSFNSIFGAGTSRDDGKSGLQRKPSKLNPTDHGLAARRVEGDDDEVSLQSQLVWGFGELDLYNGRIVVKQKPGDELICDIEVAFSDVYESSHSGPKRYVFVLRAQHPKSRAVYLSTDSAKAFSMIRNAVFTGRAKTLLDLYHSKRLA